MDMIERKTWEEFREVGLLWWVNRIIHIFGWAIVVEIDEAKVLACYPARVKFRGFDPASESEGFIALTNRMAQDSTQLKEEANL